MMCGAPDGDETFLMPLKKRNHLSCPDDGHDTGLDECSSNDDVNDSVIGPGLLCFKDSIEWQSTKSTAAGLFRTLGQHYDQPWFPTVVNEWSALYYQCSHATDYWRARDEWLDGDEEVRLTVWMEVLRHREQHERRLEQLRQNALRDTGECDPETNLMDVHDGPAFEVTETRGRPNEADERFDLEHKIVEQFCEEDLPSVDERARAEAEVAEIALADPDDDPDWVQMRRKMRGSFAALNRARCDVSAELLDHIMIELCKYWANVPAISDHSSCHIDQQLERNIMREIQNFRFKLFNVAVEIEPHIQQVVLEACQELKLCREPETFQTPKPCREQEPCWTPDPCQKQGPRKKPEPCCPLPPPKPKCAPRRSTKTKLAEAQARHNAVQVRDRDITTGWTGRQ